MPAGDATGTVRTTAELLARYADSAPNKSSNRQLHRDQITSLAYYPTLVAEAGVVDERYPYGDVRRFGAKGDGVTDDTAAIQGAVNVAKITKQPVYLPPNTFKTTSPIILNDHYLSLIGLGEASVGRGSESGSTTYGPTIRYSGTGTALIVGLNPDGDRNFIYGTKIQNLRIETDNGCTLGMRVWHSAHGRFDRLAIFGMKGPTNIGLKVEAGIDNIYEQIDINGIGQTVGASSAEYAMGLYAKLGFGNDLATTTIFRRCYFHYCDNAVKLEYIYEFEDCIFEASTNGVLYNTDTVSTFTRCWWEANVTQDIYLANGKATLNGGRFNTYARQSVFSGGNGAQRVALRDVEITSNHASPLLFASGPLAMSATGRCIISGCSFPTNFSLGGSGNNDYRRINHTDMRKQVYRFKAAAVTGSVTISPMLQESGLAMSIVLPEKGHFIGVNLYSSGALTGGTYDCAVLQNGAVLTGGGTAAQNFNFPAVSTQRVFTAIPHFLHKFAAGDLLSFYFHTTTLTSTTDFYVEVIVAFGEDGI